jgi:glycosyltransferase involved in cell wall biosynthesis
MFVEFLYPVVSRGQVPFAGGIEVQLALLGRGLARNGFDVTAVTCDYGQPDGLEVDGIRLLKSYPPLGGLPVVRFLHPRLTRGIGALRRANADVYIVQGAALWTGIVRDLAAAMGRRFVWLVGHDHDVLASLPELSNWRDRVWVRRAIRGADRIVSQTEKQRRVLRETYGRESEVIPNPVELPAAGLVVDAGGPASVAWLATYKPSKRPEWFTRFAERHPDVHCRMAGVIPDPPLTRECWEEARAVAARCANLEVLPTIPHERIGEFLRGATLFAHSSPAEGFPNAFLEAWAQGLPCVTSFDPDGLIERERLGACRDDYGRWEAELERRIAEPALRREEGARARSYAVAHHDPDAIHRRLAALLRDVIDAPRTRGH